MAGRAWRGTLAVEDFVAHWQGAVGDAAPHRHFAAQAVFAEAPGVSTMAMIGSPRGAAC